MKQTHGDGVFILDFEASWLLDFASQEFSTLGETRREDTMALRQRDADNES